ncbi:MAG: hypothetical protein HY709_09955 [Candidatus Latescibacteria bacterium]|nr:hypothetical protein [Candidatus Latescibacterota bacterium]
MTDRERWVRTMHFQGVDRIPDEEFGYWSDTFTTWHEQGLPREVTDNGIADRYFGFSRRKHVPISLGIMPGFETQVIEETERHRIIIDGAGVMCMVKKDGTSSIPKYLKFPVESRDDWKRFKERFDPHEPRRYPENWEELKRVWTTRDYPLGIGVGSLFGWLRDWMGFERIAIASLDDPDWIEEMMEDLTNFILTVIERAVKEVEIDFASFWEDMCFNHGPIISPGQFRAWMTPRYKRITDFLKQHGVDVVYVDCDGNITELVAHWLAGGVNCMFPLEVRGGSDPWPIRERYGENVLLMGGVDKTQLIDGKKTIREELKRIEKLVEMGGYIPHVDHRCPPDVTFGNYLYYLRTKREMLGIPEPAPWEERKELYD